MRRLLGGTVAAVLILYAFGFSVWRWLIPPLLDPGLEAKVAALAPRGQPDNFILGLGIRQPDNPDVDLLHHVCRSPSEALRRFAPVAEKLDHGPPGPAPAWLRWCSEAAVDCARAELEAKHGDRAADVELQLLQAGLAAPFDCPLATSAAADLKRVLLRADYYPDHEYTISLAELRRLRDSLRTVNPGPVELEEVRLRELGAALVHLANFRTATRLPGPVWKLRQRHRILNLFTLETPYAQALEVYPGTFPSDRKLQDWDLCNSDAYQWYRSFLSDIAEVKFIVAARLFRHDHGRWPKPAELDPADVVKVGTHTPGVSDTPR